MNDFRSRPIIIQIYIHPYDEWGPTLSHGNSHAVASSAQEPMTAMETASSGLGNELLTYT